MVPSSSSSSVISWLESLPSPNTCRKRKRKIANNPDTSEPPKKFRKPLAERSQNIMPPARGSQERRVSPRKKIGRSQDAGVQQSAGADAGAEDEAKTGGSASLVASSGAFDTDERLQPSDSISVATAATTSISGKIRTRRDLSPVKNPSDLLFASRPVKRYSPGDLEIPSDVQDLAIKLRKAKRGRQIIPIACRKFLETLAGGDELLPEDFDETQNNLEDVQYEMDHLVEIVMRANVLEREGAPEASWNDEVHSDLLRLALRSFDGVRHFNVSSAKPCSQFVDKNISGLQQGSKLVDYTVNLELCSQDAEKRVRSLLTSQRHQTVNQIDSPPTRLKPAAFAVETKAPSGDHEEGMSQLCAWSSAHFERLRTLLPAQTPLPTIPLLLLSVQGLSVHFAIDLPEQKEVAILRAVDLGPARTTPDMYRHLAALKTLAGWADFNYRSWVENVLL